MAAPIIVKRLQQAVFEGLASQNRVAGSGGGSGLGILTATSSVHGGNSAGNPGKAFTVAVDTLITDGGTPAISAQLTMSPPRITSYLFLGVVVVQGPSAGTQGGFINIYVDNAQPGDAPLPDFGNTSATSTLYQTIPILYVRTLQSGSSHTFALKINTTSATYTVFSFDLYGIQLG